MPFIQTALLSSRGAPGSDGEMINHFVGVRIRVVGSGTLVMTLRSQDNIRSLAVPTITMASVARLAPFRNTNFVEQRAQLKLETLLIDETFRVNRILVFIKPTAVMEPA